MRDDRKNDSRKGHARHIVKRAIIQNERDRHGEGCTFSPVVKQQARDTPPPASPDVKHNVGKTDIQARSKVRQGASIPAAFVVNTVKKSASGTRQRTETADSETQKALRDDAVNAAHTAVGVIRADIRAKAAKAAEKMKGQTGGQVDPEALDTVRKYVAEHRQEARPNNAAPNTIEPFREDRLQSFLNRHQIISKQDVKEHIRRNVAKHGLTRKNDALSDNIRQTGGVYTYQKD